MLGAGSSGREAGRNRTRTEHQRGCATAPDRSLLAASSVTVAAGSRPSRRLTCFPRGAGPRRRTSRSDCLWSSDPAVLTTLLQWPRKEQQAFRTGDCREAARGRVAGGGRQILEVSDRPHATLSARTCASNEHQSNQDEHRSPSHGKTSHGAHKAASERHIQAAIRRPAGVKQRSGGGMCTGRCGRRLTPTILGYHEQ